ncbi:hypothetical protein [Nocardioides panacisoli]|uniref:DUF4190 domain-containing protein n=1 Tax=Nocardioides panacisoli TaxID=627624 RepID=A0ABP7IEK0_9ACTN
MSQPPPNGPYGGGPYPPSPGYPGYGYPPPAADHPQTTTIMILGILGLVLCQVCAPFAWVMGSRARKEIAAAPPGTYGPSTGITVGWVLGIVGSVLLILGVLFFVVYFVIIIAVLGASVSSS